MEIEGTGRVETNHVETAAPERINPTRLKAGEEALGWVFGSTASAIGFGAQDIASGGGGLVWDAARIAGLHMRMRSEARLKAAEKIRRLEWATAAMPREDFQIAQMAFTPRGLPVEVLRAFKKREGKRNLAVVASFKSPLAAELRDRTRPGESVIAFLQWKCASLNPEKPVPPRLLRIRDEADAMVDAVIARFVPILDERQAVDFEIRSLRRVQRDKENAALAGKLQPKRPQTVEERMRAIDELVQRMTSGGAAG